MEHGRKWSNFLKPSHRKGSALKAFLSTSRILDISLKKHQRSTFLNKKYLSHICWDFSLLGVCFTSSPAFQQCLIKNPVLLKLRSRINVKSWHSVINPLYMIRGEAGEKKTRSQVSTHIFVHCLHVFHSKIPQYTYPWLWELTWLQIRPSVFGFIPPKNKIPIMCGVLHIFAFTSHSTHRWMYRLKKNEVPPSKGKHYYRYTDL